MSIKNYSPIDCSTFHCIFKNMKHLAEVSVIIPSYKSSKTLYKCLESVTKQCTQWRYKVIVVHSGSEPISEDILSAFDEVRFYSFHTRWLPGKARNWAVKQFDAPWILFLDSDCIVPDNWIETLVCKAIEHDADGIGGGIQNATQWNLLSWIMHLLEFGEWLPKGEPRLYDNFPSCNALYKRSALLEVGGFPEDLFH